MLDLKKDRVVAYILLPSETTVSDDKAFIEGMCGLLSLWAYSPPGMISAYSISDPVNRGQMLVFVQDAAGPSLMNSLIHPEVERRPLRFPFQVDP